MPRGPSDSSSQIKTKIKKTGTPKVVRKGKASVSPKKAVVKRSVVKSPVKKLVKALTNRKSSAKTEKSYLLKLEKENASKKVKKKDTAKEKLKIKNNTSEVKNLTKSEKKQDKTVKQEKKTNSEKNNSKKLDNSQVVKRGRKRKIDETKPANSAVKSILNIDIKEKAMNKKIKVGSEQIENLLSEKEELNSSKCSGTSKLTIEQNQKPIKRVTRTLQKRDTSKYEDQHCSAEFPKQKAQKDTGDKSGIRKTRLTREKDKASEEILAELATIKAGTNTKSVENLSENKSTEEFSNKNTSEKNIVTRKTRQTLKQGEENITVMPQEAKLVETKLTENKSVIKVPVIREFEKTSVEKHGEPIIRNNRSLRSTLKNLKESDNENSTDNLSISMEKTTVVQGETRLYENKLEEQSVSKVSVIKEAEKTSAEQKPIAPSIRKIRSLRLVKASENEDSSDNASASEFSENDSLSNLKVKRESQKREQLLKPVESISFKGTTEEKVIKNETSEVEMHTTIQTLNINYNEHSKSVSGCETRSITKQITNETYNSEEEKSIGKVSPNQGTSSNISVDLSERNESSAENVENNSMNSADIEMQLKNFIDSDKPSHNPISSDDCPGISLEIDSNQADDHILEISEPSDAVKIKTGVKDAKELSNELYEKLEIIPGKTVLNDTLMRDTTETSTQCTVSLCELEKSSKLEKCNAEDEVLVTDSLEMLTKIHQENAVIPSETENSLKLEKFNVSSDHISNTLEETSSNILIKLQCETTVTLSSEKVDLNPSPNSISSEHLKNTLEKDISETCTEMQYKTAASNSESTLDLKNSKISSEEINEASVKEDSKAETEMEYKCTISPQNFIPEQLKSSENVAWEQGKLSTEKKSLECDKGFSESISQNSSPEGKDTSSEHAIENYVSVTHMIKQGHSSDREFHRVKTTDNLQENSESNLLPDGSISHVEKISHAESYNEAKPLLNKIDGNHSEIISSQRENPEEKDPPSKTFQVDGTNMVDNVVTQSVVKPTLCKEKTNMSSENLADISTTLKMVETNNDHYLKSSDNNKNDDRSNFGIKDSGGDVGNIGSPRIDSQIVESAGKKKFVDSQTFSDETKIEACFSATSHVQSNVHKTFTAEIPSEIISGNSNLVPYSTNQDSPGDPLNPTFSSETVSINLVKSITLNEPCEEDVQSVSFASVQSSKNEDEIERKLVESETDLSNIVKDDASLPIKNSTLSFLDSTSDNLISGTACETSVEKSFDTKEQIEKTTDFEFQSLEDTHVSLKTGSSKLEYSKNKESDADEIKKDSNAAEGKDQTSKFYGNKSTTESLDINLNETDGYEPNNMKGKTSLESLDACEDCSKSSEEISKQKLNVTSLQLISNKNDDESLDKNVSFQTYNAKKLNELANLPIKIVSVHAGVKYSITKEINSTEIIPTVNMSFMPPNQKQDSVGDFSDTDEDKKIVSGKKSQSCMSFNLNVVKCSSVDENRSLFNKNEAGDEKDILKESHGFFEMSRNLNAIPLTVEASTDSNLQVSCDNDSTSAATLVGEEDISTEAADSEDKKEKESSRNLNALPVAVETSTYEDFHLSRDNDSTFAAALVGKESVSIGAFPGSGNEKKENSLTEALMDAGYKDKKILDEVSGEFVDIDSFSNVACSSNEKIGKPEEPLNSIESISNQDSTNHKNVKRKLDDSDGGIVTSVTKSVKLDIESDKPKTEETDISNPKVCHTNEISNCIMGDQSNRNIAEVVCTVHKNTSPKNVLSKEEIVSECEQKIDTELSYNKDNLGTNESTSNILVSQSEKNVPIENSIGNLSDYSKPSSSKSSSKRKAADIEDSNELKRVKSNTPPVREYLDQFVPFLLEGLLKIAYNRPEDPIQYLAEWMIFNKDEAYKRIRVAR